MHTNILRQGSEIRLCIGDANGSCAGAYLVTLDELVMLQERIETFLHPPKSNAIPDPKTGHPFLIYRRSS